MKSLSPSSRLVAAALVLAFVVLALVAAMRPRAADLPGAGSGSVAALATAEPATQPRYPVRRRSAVDRPTDRGRDGGRTRRDHPADRRRPTTSPTKPATCKRTDQDRYVYNPSRLAVQAACIRVTGTVEAIRHEADGDLHILLALDSAYVHLLRPANQGEELGDLVVEPVCVRSVSQTDAIALCASDPDPFPGPFPVVGERIWMEGRYVFDLEHGGWAELHPLYRWGDR